jgi:hypothetical protein
VSIAGTSCYPCHKSITGTKSMEKLNMEIIV